MCLDWTESCDCVSAFAFCLFFFFLVNRNIWLNLSWTVHPCTVHGSYKLHFSVIFSLKNGSHSTIYTFKNYFATIFSVSVFSFSKNKLNPNGSVVTFPRNVHSRLLHMHGKLAKSVKKMSCCSNQSKKHSLNLYYAPDKSFVGY